MQNRLSVTHEHHQKNVSNAFDNRTSSPPTNLFDEHNLKNYEKLSAVDMELVKLQSIQAINTLNLLHAQSQRMPLLNHLIQGYNNINQVKF